MSLDRVQAASIKASPWLKRVKYENTGGEAVAQPFVLYGHRGDSGDLASAQTVSGNTKNSRKFRWLVPYGTYEGSIRIPHRDIALSRKDKDAAARALQYEVDLGLKQRAANIVRLWFSSPGYALNATSASHTAGVITLANAQQASQFVPGDELVISANDGDATTDTIVAGSGVGYVVSRDLRAGTVSVSATPGGAVGAPTNWAAATSYFYFRRGEFLPTSALPADIITPLGMYLPSTPQTSTLHNVDRSVDSILSGFNPADASLTGKSIAARIKRTVNEHREQLGYMAEDSEIDTAYVNPVDWGKCEEELTTHLSRDPAKTASDGYQYLEITTANGTLQLISEPQVPRGTCYLLAQGDIKWHTPNGSVSEMVDEDGNICSRMANSNDLELRPVSYIAAVLRGAPHKHCRLSLTV